ncbi:MAG TPA: hypothetical protein VF552_03010 [Allosphingosinicella sp.]|jgi:hypothetical protein
MPISDPAGLDIRPEPGADPFAFTPVPVRARRDGWTPERQRRFVDLLVAGCGPSEAAQAVGKSKQSAFVLRGRPGAESFAAAWDAAVEFAQGRRGAAQPPGDHKRAVEGVLVPRFYRGRLVSVERRFPHGSLVRLLAQLDRWKPRVGDAGHGAPSFEELLDALAPPAPVPRRRRPPADRHALDRRFGRTEAGCGGSGTQAEPPEVDRFAGDAA